MFEILWNNTLEVAFDRRDISTQGESQMRTFFLSSIAGAVLVTGGGLAAAPMEQDMDRGYAIVMGAKGPESRPAPQERRSVATVDLSPDQKTRLHAIVAGGIYTASTT